MPVLEPQLPGREAAGSPLVLREGGERAARQALRRQCAALEAELAACLTSAFGGDPLRSLELDADAVRPVRLPAGPRLLALGELEALRDRLATRVARARAELRARGAEQDRARRRLEAMLLAPGDHRFEQVTNRELGEGGCGVWRVKPRLGLVGMLAGWWEVKLSSGCP